MKKGNEFVVSIASYPSAHSGILVTLSIISVPFHILRTSARNTTDSIRRVKSEVNS